LLTIIWVATHVILFYLLAAGGFLVDLMLYLLKSVMFPGSPQTMPVEMTGWTTPLQVGMTLGGAAGILLGLSLVLRGRRKWLSIGFWLLLLAGVLFEISAVFILVSKAFS
jgi:hypothetical protein